MDEIKKTYTGGINEFVDWVTGSDVLEGNNVTGGLPVSGGSIRQLLQEKLRKPFSIYEDQDAGLYRMFSSDDAKALYIMDKDVYSDLELFNFQKPSEYELSVVINNPNPRYLMADSNVHDGSTILYTWGVKRGNSLTSDTVVATYVVTDKDGNKKQFSETYSSTKTTVSVDFFRYLKDGENTINISLKGLATAATASYAMQMTVLTLELDSTFNFNKQYIVGDALDVPYTIKRNNTLVDSIIKFYIDGKLVQSRSIASGSAGLFITNTVTIPTDVQPGQHSLQLQVEIQYDTTNTFKSKVLYYDFVIAQDTEILDYFINIKTKLNSIVFKTSPDSESQNDVDLLLSATQYDTYVLDWGYYTNNIQKDTQITADWKLKYRNDTASLSTLRADKGRQSVSLQFAPEIYTEENTVAKLECWYGNKLLRSLNMFISKSTLTMYETSNYALKLNAIGKANNGQAGAKWEYRQGNNVIKTIFTNIPWTLQNGWYDNSFITFGPNSYATVQYAPLSNNPANGRTIEFEFQSVNVADENDVILLFGTPNGGRIQVTPSEAALYSNSGLKVCYTNFKSNERIKLAFIFNPPGASVDSGLVYIVNNGILERGSGIGGVTLESKDFIKIGGSNSGIRLYNLRVYNRAITYNDEYNNFVFDNPNKVEIIQNNNVVGASGLSYELCVNKVDTILIRGDLTDILNQNTNKEQSIGYVTIERTCPEDKTKNFVCEGCQIRKHGQSTLNYPITSMKFWLNKGKDGTIPKFTCQGQQDYGFNKNRYMMKDDSIPANKFILQANYADSSGVSNGGLQNLIQNTWYNAVIDGEYKLRTEPQLFATSTKITHNNVENLNDDPSYVSGLNEENKQWNNYFDQPFPHTIRISPDSFPCVVFYQDTTKVNAQITFLGQYVFMEDKKSDFNYGERSIYKTMRKDPFCLTIANKDGDKKANRIWNNKDVLRIEVLSVNSEFSSFTTDNALEEILYDKITGKPTQYNWENSYELIYPDPDDVVGSTEAGTDKFGFQSEFNNTVKPFLDWYKWVISTKDNHQKFQQEASRHLDLYKMAAYYIYYLRFGLVDSVERNAQIKTYDGIHFHYEPWDMDISMGKKNTGGIAFEPPMDRNTTLPGDKTTYAFSGRSGLPDTPGYRSNWLWDALESWNYWTDVIVPQVADALYKAGLRYEIFTDLFDEDYSNKWCEIIYNESCHYKYVEKRGGSNSWLDWLQGSGKSYRHWWTSVSNDYYNAKWDCGEFKNHAIYMGVEKTDKSGDLEADPNYTRDIIEIIPTKKTYFSIFKNERTKLDGGYATKENPARFDVSRQAFSTKEPVHIYGADYIEELDLSCISLGLSTINFTGSFSEVHGACIKKLNLGTNPTKVNDNEYRGVINDRQGSAISDVSEEKDAFAALQEINIRGMKTLKNSGFWDNFKNKNRTLLKNVYAMGSGLQSFDSAINGNQYQTLELPEVEKLSLVDSSWDTLTFWKTNVLDEYNNATFTRCNINGDYSLSIPESLKTVEFNGTTAHSKKSLDFILNWIDCIEARGQRIEDHSLFMDDVKWVIGDGFADTITFDQLAKIAKFNNGINYLGTTMRGCIMISDKQPELTVEQLSLIKQWFGETCFNKTSSGLVIDHKRNYIQINIGNPAYIKDGVININEGVDSNGNPVKAYLNATQFILSEDERIYDWSLQSVEQTGSGGSVYKSCSIRTNAETGLTTLTVNESTNNPYDVMIVCDPGDGSDVYKLKIHVNTVTYPKQGTSVAHQVINVNGGVRKRKSYYFTKIGVDCEFFPGFTQEFTATIKTVHYSVKRGDQYILAKTNYSALINGTNDSAALDDILDYHKNPNNVYALRLINKTVFEEPVNYECVMYIEFYGNYEMRLPFTITVIDDPVIILRQNVGNHLYDAVLRSYKSIFNNSEPDNGNFFKSDLCDLETLDIVLPDDNEISFETINNTQIFDYLTALKTLYIGNHNTGTYGPVVNSDLNSGTINHTSSQLVFRGLINLENFFYGYINEPTAINSLSFPNSSKLKNVGIYNKELILMDGSNVSVIYGKDLHGLTMREPLRIPTLSIKITDYPNGDIVLSDFPNDNLFTKLATVL